MEKIVLYDHRGDPVEATAKKSRAWGFVPAALGLALAIQGMGMSWNLYQKYHKPEPVAVWGSGTLTIGGAHFIAPYDPNHAKIELLDGYYSKKLNLAVDRWEKALAHKIRRPRLFLAEHSCGTASVMACASEDSYEIRITSNLYEADEDTVLLHELGHLLGVPHIEGDDLMNAMYTKKVTAPTPMAVAIAKLKR